MLYDIILPLAIDGVFTYNIPDSIDENSVVGMRVLAPLGKNKIYTGVVFKAHEGELAEQVKVKDIIEIIDDKPIVTRQQLSLWQWVSAYYMCSIGEVMKAALPSAFRLESETHVCINAEYEASSVLPRSMQQILDCLSDGKEKTIDEIGKTIGLKSVINHLRKLQEEGAVLIGEQVEDKYRPKLEPWISLAPAYEENEAGLQIMLNALERAKKQQLLLLAFLGMTEETSSVRRSELLSLTGVSPAILNALIAKGVLCQQMRATERLQNFSASVSANPLNQEQTAAKQQIEQLWKEKNVVLLHGVTGSGKTEIYIHLIQDAINEGKQVLYLVPEIALTTQLTERLQSVFGEQLGVYHSRFSDQERMEIYRNLLEEKHYKVILGVRSSLFLPFKNLGLVIIDEEHDGSYKQQDPAPRYHARNTALFLAQQFHAKTLLGTATPAVETYYNAVSGKIGLVELLHRHGDIELPKIRIIDTRLQYHRKEMQGHFADPLVRKISDEIGRNKQIIVFQNRRGFASWIECRQCAYVPKCANCDVSLTLHKRQGIMVCHYCGYSIPVPDKCPVCGQHTLSDHGMGTEKIEDELHGMFPAAKVSRMDLDTTRNKHAYQRIIDDFAAHKTDILVGTQMVSKGLHFDDVSTVAVLNADSLMNQPDFRSYERAYQMLEQVSGRAGRKAEQGEVIIQTANPDKPIFRYLKAHDYKALYEEQIQERKDFRYPPFYRLMMITVKHRDGKKVDEVASLLHARLSAVFTRRCSRVTQPAISKMQNMYIRNILLKIEADAPYSKAKQLLGEQIMEIKKMPEAKGAVIFVDVDPM